MTPTVAFACRQCGRPVERPFPAAEPPAPCAGCRATPELDAAAVVEGAIASCPVCRCPMLYRQRDFNQKVGLAVVVVAAVLAPFTWYVSLGVAALIDALLYKLSGEVVVCYRTKCRAHVRGLAPGPKVVPFDLSIHDYYRMLARREEQGLEGPDPSTGPPLDSMSRH